MLVPCRWRVSGGVKKTTKSYTKGTFEGGCIEMTRRLVVEGPMMGNGHSRAGDNRAEADDGEIRLLTGEAFPESLRPKDPLQRKKASYDGSITAEGKQTAPLTVCASRAKFENS